MGWNGQYALDGFFQFGAPLTVNRYVIDPADNKFGQSTDTYWVARFLLDEEIYVIERLDTLLRGPIVYYPVVYLLRRSSVSVGPDWVMERQFYKSWLFGREGEFYDPRNPGVSTGGQVITLAFHKADNRHIRPSP